MLKLYKTELDFWEILEVFIDENFIFISVFNDFNKTSVKIDKFILSIIIRYE